MLTTFAEIARFLSTQENGGNRAILFLGSRTGFFFDNEFLYDLLKDFSPKNFENLSSIEVFHECYSIMETRLSERDANAALESALGSVKDREEDNILAELLEAGVFDSVITTNIDSLLEDTLKERRIKKPQPINGYTTSNFHLDTKRIPIVKVFGELESRKYRIPGGIWNIKNNWQLQSFLSSKLSSDVLVIGYDLIWDGIVEPLFSKTGGKIIYVNEKLPPEGSHISEAIKKREGQYLVGNLGSYRLFMIEYKKMLHLKGIRDLLEFEHNENNNRTISIVSDTNNGKPISSSEKSLSIIDKEHTQENTYSQSTLEIRSRKTIFISYSHKDKRFLEDLQPYLTSYERAGNVDYWSDKKIEVGTNWQEKIMQALEAAQGAILLISQNFLSSKFIMEIELPQLLIATRSKDAKIIPVILSKCLIRDTPLDQFQAINSPERPMNRMRPYERNEIWVEIVRRLKEI